MPSFIYDFIVEMRTGGSSRVAAFPYAFSPLYLHALDHAYGLEMGIPRLVSEAMVYDHGISISEELEFHAFHHAVTCRIDRVAGLKGKIHTAMTLCAAGKRIAPVAETT